MIAVVKNLIIKPMHVLIYQLIYAAHSLVLLGKEIKLVAHLILHLPRQLLLHHLILLLLHPRHTLLHLTHHLQVLLARQSGGRLDAVRVVSRGRAS